MRKYAVMNAKGGVGKTTTTSNVAFGLAKLGWRTVVVDLDTQGQMSIGLGVSCEAGISELALGQVELAEAMTQVRDNLWLLAGGRGLASLQQDIARRDMASERVLSEALAGIEEQDLADVVLVDTAPSWSNLNVNCLFYVDQVILPVNMETLSLHGVVDFVRSVEGVQKYREGVEISMVVPTFYDGRTKKSLEILGQLKSYFGEDKVVDPIRSNVKLSEAAGQGVSIFDYAPKSNGAKDYAGLIQRLVADLGA